MVVADLPHFIIYMQSLICSLRETSNTFEEKHTIGAQTQQIAREHGSIVQGKMKTGCLGRCMQRKLRRAKPSMHAAEKYLWGKQSSAMFLYLFIYLFLKANSGETCKLLNKITITKLPSILEYSFGDWQQEKVEPMTQNKTIRIQEYSM